jgi:hypothetical protein
MKYLIGIHENEDPKGVRFIANVFPIECVFEEESIDELYRNAPSIIKDVVELSNNNGAGLPLPTAFEFRLLVNA